MLHALIIEDEVLIALEIQGQLHDLGYDSFDFAVSPYEALACARARRPDLVTADFRILAGTGVQAVELVVEVCGPLPVIYITANVEQVRDCGAPVVEKPIDARKLAAACAAAQAVVRRRSAE